MASEGGFEDEDGSSENKLDESSAEDDSRRALGRDLMKLSEDVINRTFWIDSTPTQEEEVSSEVTNLDAFAPIVATR